MTVLKCSDLAIGYDGKAILSDINIDIPDGTMTVLIGANGCGKSTLLRTLAGLQAPIKGTVELAGLNLRKAKRSQLAGLRAIVDTYRSGGGALTVAETVAIGRNKSVSLFGGMSYADKAIVNGAMSSVGITELSKRYLATLSDGERQKVMIARALAQDTPLIFLDEPTSFLDVAARIETMNLLHNLCREGKTIILSTHDVAPAISRADYLVVIDKKNRNVEIGERQSLIESGALDRAFADRGVHFDLSVLDYR